MLQIATPLVFVCLFVCRFFYMMLYLVILVAAFVRMGEYYNVQIVTVRGTSILNWLLTKWNLLYISLVYPLLFLYVCLWNWFLQCLINSTLFWKASTLKIWVKSFISLNFSIVLTFLNIFHRLQYHLLQGNQKSQTY